MVCLLQQIIKKIDAANRFIGRVIMYGIFFLMAILLWSSISKTLFLPSLWTLEMAQFAMVTYYILGGPYSIQLKANIRMDLFYSQWSDLTKAWVDAFSVLILAFYLSVMLYGAYDSLVYALQYDERSSSVWHPYLWPIKTVIFAGIVMMLLQVFSEFCKDIIKIKLGQNQVREI